MSYDNCDDDGGENGDDDAIYWTLAVYRYRTNKLFGYVNLFYPYLYCSVKNW